VTDRMPRARTWPYPAELEPLRRHFRNPPEDLFLGPGWWDLVLRCHDSVVSEFPEYELLAVKQKWAQLAFQAFPRPWKPGGDWTRDESRRLDDLIGPFVEVSRRTCERCGDPGLLRETRFIELTLCDGCEAAVPADGGVLPRTAP
jgi:hypothetical protein